jgi:hypothetical protein
MAEDVGAADLIADGRLQLGISRGSHEQVIDDDHDRAYFGRGLRKRTRLCFIDASTLAIFGRSYAAEPDVLIE